MGKKCLIVYASFSGNTEKVALRFKSTFEKHGWQCDIFKLERKMNLIPLPFNFYDYDFVCVGSGVEIHEPYNEILASIRIPRYGIDPKFPPADMPKRKSNEKPGKGKGPVAHHHHKIVFGPESKKAVAFVTYAGYEFGPKEAQPPLELLALEIEHLEFECIGKFCCPGKFMNDPTPTTYHGDIRSRPDERDLLKAEMFIEEKLEQIADRTV